MYYLRNVKNQVINIGSKKEYSIKNFAKIICDYVGYDFGKIVFDKNKYVGSKGKKLNITKIQKYIRDYKKNLTEEKEGIAEVIEWFIRNKKF